MQLADVICVVAKVDEIFVRPEREGTASGVGLGWVGLGQLKGKDNDDDDDDDDDE